MLLPKKVKHRKWHKLRHRNQGIASRMTSVSFGLYGLRAMGHGWISSRQIEAVRRVLTRYVRRGGKIWIRVFPDHPVTKKGNELPMGGGKGSPEFFVSAVKPGAIMFEIGGIREDKAREALTLAGQKLPVKAKVVERVN